MYTIGDGVNRIYAGFIPDLLASGARLRRGAENYRQEANEIDCGFISDLCRIYSPFRRFKVERLKKGVHKSAAPLGPRT